LLKRLRVWLQVQTPIDEPRLVNLNIQEVVSDFGITDEPLQLRFQLPKSATVSSDFSLSKHPILSNDLSNLQPEPAGVDNHFSPLIAPQSEKRPFPKLEYIPETIDVLTILGAPGFAGKSYGVNGKERKTIQQLPFAPRTVDKSICRHGFRKFECATCKEEREQKRRKRIPYLDKIKVVNVFDLILPLLQPPFEHMLEQPILFPPGRRPFDYQVTGIRFLIERHTALLGDDMGLGKTIQTIIGIRILVRRRMVKRVLILCPLSLLGNWEKEIKKWAPELFVIKVRGTKELREGLWKSKSTVYLSTYETLRDDTNRHFISGTKFNLVVLDEIQRIKNPNSGTSRAVRKLGPKYRWGLSGTPLENKLDDVIAIFRFLEPQVFKSDLEYSNSQVRQKIKPHFLRRRIQDVRNEFPNKYPSEVWLDLNDAQRIKYDIVFAEGRAEISRPGTTRIHVFAWLSKLKQICNIEEESGDSCKIDYLQNELPEIVDGGYKALIFSQFPNKTLMDMKERLREFEPEIFYGGLSSRQREQLINDFQETEKPKVLLASIKTAGFGLNLTRANHVFHFDHWWNPAVARQAVARAWRIGQALPVFEHDIYTNDTVEQRIHEILAEKQVLFDEVIDDLSAEYTMSAFSDEELYRIFDLEKPTTIDSAKPTRPKPWVISLEKLSRLNPKQFEQIVANYYEKLNFKVEVSGGAYDQGVDVIARRISDIGEDYLIVQCKHHPNSNLGPNYVREMIGTLQSHPEATRAFLVTSGTFSEEAVHLAEKHNISLIDGNYLVTLLHKYQIPLSL
jgi:superfamily II DNA or RNA helicase/HJR/Mrr/RecB family endonuclease